MPLHETEAFILRTYTLKEADKICVFLARDAGKLRGVAHGARRLKSKYGASLEPFTEVSITYFQKETRELVSISNCEIIRSQFEAVTSSEMLAALHHLAKLVIEFLPDHEPNERVYRLIAASMEALRQVPPDNPAVLVRYFEVWLLKLAGFFPEMQHCAGCGQKLEGEASAWLTAEGTPKCAACSNRLGEEWRAEVRRVIQDILHQPPRSFVAVPHQARALEQVKTLTRRLIERALERGVDSYEFLDRLKPEQVA
jgi:DNA repair protein RecO (recombination protein O)